MVCMLWFTSSQEPSSKGFSRYRDGALVGASSSLPEMLEVTNQFTALSDGCKNSYVAFAVLAPRRIDWNDVREQIAPARVFRRNVLFAETIG